LSACPPFSGEKHGEESPRFRRPGSAIHAFMFRFARLVFRSGRGEKGPTNVTGTAVSQLPRDAGGGYERKPVARKSAAW